MKTSNGSGALIYAKLSAPLYKKACIKDLLIDLNFFSSDLLKLNLNQGTWSIASFSDLIELILSLGTWSVASFQMFVYC